MRNFPILLHSAVSSLEPQYFKRPSLNLLNAVGPSKNSRKAFILPSQDSQLGGGEDLPVLCQNSGRSNGQFSSLQTRAQKPDQMKLLYSGQNVGRYVLQEAGSVQAGHTWVNRSSSSASWDEADVEWEVSAEIAFVQKAHVQWSVEPVPELFVESSEGAASPNFSEKRTFLKTPGHGFLKSDVSALVKLDIQQVSEKSAVPPTPDWANSTDRQSNDVVESHFS